jgi:hypothetical protein
MGEEREEGGVRGGREGGRRESREMREEEKALLPGQIFSEKFYFSREFCSTIKKKF